MRTALTVVVTALAAVAVVVALGLGSAPSGPDLPTVVSISHRTASDQVLRQWSDGRLDVVILNGISCSPSVVECVGQLVPGMTTFADVDRDGYVGITDFLAVLGNWNPAP